MKALNHQDLALIEAARAALRPNYDGVRFNHTVGAAVLCGNGRVYTGVNVYSIHGACAEQVALGAAITSGERDFITIVAVRGADGEEIIPPCGNCRQILCDYAPECEVIVTEKAGAANFEERSYQEAGGARQAAGEAGDEALRPVKIKAKELLPFAYEVEGF